MGTLTNPEGPEEMPQNAVIHRRVGVIKIVIVINCNLITFSKVVACNCN